MELKTSICVTFYWFLIKICTASEVEEVPNSKLFKIEGKVAVPYNADQDWISSTGILVDGGLHMGLLKSDGSFAVNNLPGGSYVLEITHPSFVFEPARVDITQKGKIRARRVNNININDVSHISYPLKFKAKGKPNYFQLREQWKITDFLFNPMIMMMVLPFFMLMVLPKLMNSADPETQREMQSQMNMLNPKQNMPDFSEMLTNWLGGGQTKKAVKSKPKRR